ncbi:MAG: tyrosine-type recombinase/integrase [Verrucomicrobiia bacterium]
MASLHKQPGKPFFFAAFSTADGKRHFKSTGTSDRREAEKIATGWTKAAELAAHNALTPDRARKLIESTVGDVLESHVTGSLPRDVLRDFFYKAGDLVMEPGFTRERLYGLIEQTVRQVAKACGQEVPHSSVRDWCHRWLESKALEAEPRTHERYRVAINHFLDFLGTDADKDLSTLRSESVTGFRNSLGKRLAVGSANLELKIVRACLYSALEADLVIKNVAAQVKILKERNKSSRRAFTVNEVRKIVAQCDKAGGEWRGLVLTAVYTGQRMGDVARLTWQQVNIAEGEISFVTEKTGARLEMSLAKPLREWFEAAPASDDPTAFVFPVAASIVEKRVGTLSNRFYDEILAPAGLVPARPKKHAGTGQGRNTKRQIGELSFHSFRHTMTSWLKSAGASNAIAEMIVGHDSPVVSSHYTHLGAEDTVEAISKLPDVT